MLYTQISDEERKIIDYLFNVQRKTISFIAKELKRNKSTISREIKRNSISYGYIGRIATWKAKKRQWHKHFMYILISRIYKSICEILWQKMSCSRRYLS